MVISIMRITVVCNSSSFGIGVDDNHIHYTSLHLCFLIIMRLLMSTCSCYPSVNVLDLHACRRKHPLWIRIVSFDSVALLLHPMHIDTQKVSIGMYSECDYPYKSCLCTFWPCHSYFILQFYSIVFILVSILFYWSQCNLSMPSYMVCSFNFQ